MMLVEWADTIVAELKAAGFSVTVHEGFPLVKRPATHDDRVRLLKFRTSLSADRRIYAEGMLFVPPGAWEAIAAATRGSDDA